MITEQDRTVTQDPRQNRWRCQTVGGLLSLLSPEDLTALVRQLSGYRSRRGAEVLKTRLDDLLR